MKSKLIQTYFVTQSYLFIINYITIRFTYNDMINGIVIKVLFNLKLIEILLRVFK